mmetsp:Transcript_31406/g.83575  ORF Transcript_31406/g.83575 Transcript_31406/m.83575 type:complete len:599 (-) Transcript_31406:143-1939(-)
MAKDEKVASTDALKKYEWSFHLSDSPVALTPECGLKAMAHELREQHARLAELEAEVIRLRKGATGEKKSTALEEIYDRVDWVSPPTCLTPINSPTHGGSEMRKRAADEAAGTPEPRTRIGTTSPPIPVQRAVSMPTARHDPNTLVEDLATAITSAVEQLQHQVEAVAEERKKMHVQDLATAVASAYTQLQMQLQLQQQPQVKKFDDLGAPQACQKCAASREPKYQPRSHRSSGADAGTGSCISMAGSASASVSGSASACAPLPAHLRHCGHSGSSTPWPTPTCSLGAPSSGTPRQASGHADSCDRTGVARRLARAISPEMALSRFPSNQDPDGTVPGTSSGTPRRRSSAPMHAEFGDSALPGTRGLDTPSPPTVGTPNTISSSPLALRKPHRVHGGATGSVDLGLAALQGHARVLPPKGKPRPLSSGLRSAGSSSGSARAHATPSCSLGVATPTLSDSSPHFLGRRRSASPPRVSRTAWQGLPQRSSLRMASPQALFVYELEPSAFVSSGRRLWTPRGVPVESAFVHRAQPSATSLRETSPWMNGNSARTPVHPPCYSIALDAHGGGASHGLGLGLTTSTPSLTTVCVPAMHRVSLPS